jgi:hypothetical protein
MPSPLEGSPGSPTEYRRKGKLRVYQIGRNKTCLGHIWQDNIRRKPERINQKFLN